MANYFKWVFWKLKYFSYIFPNTETHKQPSRHTGEESIELWLIPSNRNSKRHLYLTLECLFLYFLLNKIRTHVTVSFCNSLTEIIPTECTRLTAPPSLGITPILQGKPANPNRALQSAARPSSNLASPARVLSLSPTCRTLGRHSHLGDKLCPPTLPLSPFLLANIYSSFKVQLTSHSLFKCWRQVTQAKSIIPSSMLPAELAHSFQKQFPYALAELPRPFSPFWVLWIIASNTLCSSQGQVHTLLACLSSKSSALPTLALFCFPDLCSPPGPTTAEFRGKKSPKGCNSLQSCVCRVLTSSLPEPSFPTPISPKQPQAALALQVSQRNWALWSQRPITTPIISAHFHWRRNGTPASPHQQHLFHRNRAHF